MSSEEDNGLQTDDDGAVRCWWCGQDLVYRLYHDEEWGIPVDDDQRLFEKLCLEGFQAGLSWLTILKRRDGFREAFCNFDIEAVARFTKRDVSRLVKNPGIIRHRGKIESAINNARRTLDLIDQYGSLAAFLWRFEPKPDDRPERIYKETLMDLTATVESSEASKSLKKHGFTFIGPTTAYALMQAMGLVNDHIEGCQAGSRVREARRRFSRPKRL